MLTKTRPSKIEYSLTRGQVPTYKDAYMATLRIELTLGLKIIIIIVLWQKQLSEDVATLCCSNTTWLEQGCASGCGSMALVACFLKSRNDSLLDFCYKPVCCNCK